MYLLVLFETTKETGQTWRVEELVLKTLIGSPYPFQTFLYVYKKQSPGEFP